MPSSWLQKRPWLPRALPYMLAAMLVQVNTWGLMPALVPFAMANTSRGYSGDHGSGNLAIAFQLGAGMILLGELATLLFKTPIGLACVLFSTAAFVVYGGVLDMPLYHHRYSSYCVIAAYCVVRFFESNIMTTCYRQIAENFSKEHREQAIRMVGVCDQFCSTSCIIIMTIIVSQVAVCS